MTAELCPPDHALHRLIEGQLDRETERAVDRHLGVCPECVTRLEHLTNDPTLNWAALQRATDQERTEGADGEDREYISHLARLTAGPLKQHLSSPDRPVVPATLPCIPGYRFLRVLGLGGMGLVYEAEDLGLRRRVAIKMLGERQLQADSLARLRREAEAIARLKHPHIVQIHRIDTWEERPYLELEYVPGGSLADRLKGRPHAALDSARFVSRLARAIHFAHNEQVIHRDLKPSNVLLEPVVPASTVSTRESPLAVVSPKITDFGLAKLLDSDQERTRQGQLLGTPSYAPPEQLLGGGERAGPATDIYSLGAILYELLTGRAPFQGEDVWQTVQLVQHADPVSPRLLNPGVPPDLETICLKCLEKSPESRYPSAAALADDLDRYCDHRPIVARPLGWSERAVRWTRRNRAVAGLLAMITLLMLTVVAGSVASARYFYLLERQEKRLQERLRIQQQHLRHTSVGKSLALADSYRALGLAAGQNGRPHLAALYFAHAAEETADLPDDDHAEANAIRVGRFLDRCAIPTALLEHPDGVRLDDVIFHPSNRWVLCQPYERSEAQCLYDLETGERSEWPTDWGRVTAAVWTAAGERLFVGTREGRLLEAKFPGFEVVWEHRAGQPVWAVAVSAQGTSLAMATEHRQWLWQTNPVGQPSTAAEGWRLVAEIPNLPSPVIDLRFDPSGRWCLTSTHDRLLTARRAATGEPGAQLRFGWNHFDWSRIRPQFDMEGRLVVWSDFELSRVDLDRNEQLPIGRAEGGYSFEVSPHDGTILVGGNFHAQLSTPEGVRRIPGATTYSACWLEDGTALLGATDGDMLQRLDLERGTMTPWPLFQSDGIIRLRISPDQRSLATISTRGPLRIWRLPDPPGARLIRARIPTVFESDWGQVSPFDHVTPAESLLLVRRFGVNAQLHRLSDGAPAGPPLVPRGRLQDARWLPDGHRILTLATNAAESGSPPTSLDVWQGRTGERCRPTTPLAIEARPGEESPHELLAVAPRGDWLAVIENHSAGVALVPLAEETSPIRRLPLAAQWLINVPRVNSFLVVVGEEFGLTHELLLVDWDTGQITRRFAIPNVLGMRVSPEGTLVAVGTRQSEVWLLDLANQTSEPVPLPHPNWAVPDAFTADGRLLATRGKDRFFRIWDLSTRSVLAPSAEFLQHAHCTFSANDRVLLSCNLRGKLELMSAWDGQPLAPALSLGQRPIMPEEGGFRFSAAAEGNLVVVGGAPSLTILDLDRFLESPHLTGSELIDWCALVSGHRLQQGLASPLALGEWTELWKRLRARHPAAIRTGFESAEGNTRLSHSRDKP
jgi:WD40 repeat protein